jgi:cell cycle checkpoint control protein RAD9A
MSLTLDLRFTDPAAPLFIDIEGDYSESLFVISTSQVHGAATGVPTQHYQPSNSKKRERQDSSTEGGNKRPMKAVHVIDRVALPPHSFSRSPSVAGSMMPPRPELNVSCEPLFLPGSSQLSVAHEEAIRSSGLGVEDMNADELTEMMDGEGEEVAFDFSSQRPPDQVHQPSYGDTIGETGHSDSFDLQIDERDFAPTQAMDSSRVSWVLVASSPQSDIYIYPHPRPSSLCLRTEPSTIVYIPFFD